MISSTEKLYLELSTKLYIDHSSDIRTLLPHNVHPPFDGRSPKLCTAGPARSERKAHRHSRYWPESISEKYNSLDLLRFKTCLELDRQKSPYRIPLFRWSIDTCCTPRLLMQPGVVLQLRHMYTYLRLFLAKFCDFSC